MQLSERKASARADWWRPVASAVIAVLTVCAWQVRSGTASAQEPVAPDVVAVVGDVRILEAELERWWERQDAPTYYRIRREAYDARRRALDALLAERLLAAAAAQQQVSVETLLERQIAQRMRPVTDADVQGFVSSNPLPAGTSPAMVAPLVAALLRQRGAEDARAEYVSGLLRDPAARVQTFLDPPRVSVSGAAHSPMRGAADAPVQIVVFSDFECPFCRRTEPVLEQLIGRFPTEVQMVWRHFPLSVHPSARAAAEASQCAHDQSRFWVYHDALFADPSLLQPAALLATATRVGLDAVDFAQCVAAHRHAVDVAADIDAGERVGVSGTPTIFINGIAFVGALGYDVYERAVLDELTRVPGRRGQPGAELPPERP